MKDWGEPMGYEEVISKLEQRIEDNREELRMLRMDVITIATSMLERGFEAEVRDERN